MNLNRLRQVAEQNACYLTRHLAESLAFTKLSGVRNHVVNDKIKTGQSIPFPQRTQTQEEIVFTLLNNNRMLSTYLPLT